MAVQTAEIAVPETGEEPAVRGRARFRFLRNGKTLTGLVILGFFLIVAVIGPWIAPYDPSATSNDIMAAPSADHWFGTTQTGEDIFSQVLVGTRGVLVVGLIAGAVASALSVLVGVTAGFLGGAADELLSALSNIFLVIPALPLIIIIASFGEDTGDVAIALIIAVTAWAWGARVLRAQTLSLRGRDYA